MDENAYRIRALGPLRVWCGAEELELGPARQRAVFAALATRATNRPITSTQLVRAVWGADAPASATGSVHTYISGLRRILEPGRTRWSTDGALVSESAGYRLRVGPAALDAGEFDRLHASARARRREKDAAGAVEALDRALALWTGEAFAGVPGPHAASLRADLDEKRLSALEMRAEGLLALDAHEDLVPELSSLVREYPLRESLWKSLMMALHRGGRTTEALDAFRTVREILHDELGVRPGRELAEARQQILRHARRSSTATASAIRVERLAVLPRTVAHEMAVRRELPAACYGREREVTALTGFTEDVLAGGGQAVWIEAEPGMGKSELLHCALASIGERGCHVAWAEASELGRRLPFQVLLDCLGMDVTSAAAGTTAYEREAATADRILARVDRLCATAPLVMVLDDFHWADEASVRTWSRLFTAARRLPLLLITASRLLPRRTALVPARRAAEARGLQVITLGPLTDAAVDDLLGDLIGARPGETLRSCIATAAGNPRDLREVAGALVREGGLEVVGGTAQVRADAGIRAAEPMLDATDRTLHMLSEPSRETLRHAAVLGMEFDLAEVAAMLSKKPSDLLDAFEEAVELRIVVDTGVRLAFRNPLLRRALYDGRAGKASSSS
ncbi:BTAD domain-containing putative transcriptional regulator [Amycolatopsis sp. lyj-23]|uniref:BTAD domain-containing putative transcriptional regulator n=1 Tax=Amycolatopsis sp. lyj-23 TaxID=2789283 RepID=UPI00397BC37E